MSDYTITAQKRSIFGKHLRQDRKLERLPAILYGHGIENVSLFLPKREFLGVLQHAGTNTLVKLEVRDKEGKVEDVRNVLIHEVQYDPLSSSPIHADLYQVRMDEKAKVMVPLSFVGESAAVKSSAGILIKAMQALEISALPKDLPHEITVDISILETFEDKIYVKDLLLPSGVSTSVDALTPVASVAPPRSEAELKALEEKVEEKAAEVPIAGEKEAAEEEAKEEAVGPEPKK